MTTHAFQKMRMLSKTSAKGRSRSTDEGCCHGALSWALLVVRKGEGGEEGEGVVVDGTGLVGTRVDEDGEGVLDMDVDVDVDVSRVDCLAD